MLRRGARVFFWRFEDIEEETKKWYLYLFIYLYFEQHPQEKGKKNSDTKNVSKEKKMLVFVGVRTGVSGELLWCRYWCMKRSERAAPLLSFSLSFLLSK